MIADALREEARAAYRRRLHALLGIPEDATTLQMHELVVAGFPARDVAGLCERGGVPMGVRDWIVSPDAFEVRVCEGRLTVEESDRLFRAVRLIALAQSIFGEHGVEWPIVALGMAKAAQRAARGLLPPSGLPVELRPGAALTAKNDRQSGGHPFSEIQQLSELSRPTWRVGLDRIVRHTRRQ